MHPNCGGIHSGCYATKVHTMDASWRWGDKGKEWYLLRRGDVLVGIQHKDGRRTDIPSNQLQWVLVLV